MKIEQRVELVELAVEMVLDAVRHEPWIPFHRDTIHCRNPPKWFKGVTGEELVSTKEQVAIG